MRKFYPNIKNNIYLHLGLQDGVSSTYCFKKEKNEFLSVEAIVKSECTLGLTQLSSVAR